MNLERQPKPVNPLHRSLPHGDFGARGDLSRWKLIPAIGNLAAANRYRPVSPSSDLPLILSPPRASAGSWIMKSNLGDLAHRSRVLQVSTRAQRFENMLVAGGAASHALELARANLGNGLYWG